MSLISQGLCLLGLVQGADPRTGSDVPIVQAQANPPWTWPAAGTAVKRIYQTYHGLNWPPRGGEQNPFQWDRVAARFDLNHDGAISPKELNAPREWFERLDRNRDGQLTKDDFDWAPDSAIEKQTRTARQSFRAFDADGNGRLTAEEWQEAFAKVTKGKEFLTDEDFAKVLYPAATVNRAGAARRPGGRGRSNTTPFLRIQRFMEQGMPWHTEGPGVGDPGPDFVLSTPDKKQTVRLSDFRNKKPVVLSFGSFT